MLKRNLLWCNQNFSIVGDISLTDKEIFQCKICRKRYSIRVGSYYSGSKLSLKVHLCILYFFAQGSKVVQCERYLNGKIIQKSIIQWYNYYRDICTTYLAQNPVTFTPNSTVHVDETAIGGRRKYGRGRLNIPPRWLFGIVDRASHKIHLQFIRDQSHPSIIPIINQHVQRGATIHSDGAQVYKILGTQGYTHRWVVHTRHYVNPRTGVHSNHIENIWSNLEAVLKFTM